MEFHEFEIVKWSKSNRKLVEMPTENRKGSKLSPSYLTEMQVRFHGMGGASSLARDPPHPLWPPAKHLKEREKSESCNRHLVFVNAKSEDVTPCS